MHWTAFIFLALSGAWLSWQDFKARLISLWLIVLFAVANAVFYLSDNIFSGLVENTIFCIGYLLLLYVSLLLYFYLKNKKFEKLIDTQLGLGDVLVMLAIGLSLEPVAMIYFFSLALIISLLLSVLFFRKKQNIPLAGLVILNYLAFLFIKLF
jgi:hypothetical protein